MLKIFYFGSNSHNILINQKNGKIQQMLKKNNYVICKINNDL
jgi:hypothetical protein